MIQPRTITNRAAQTVLRWCLLVALSALPAAAAAVDADAAQAGVARGDVTSRGNVIVVNWDGTGDYLTIQAALDASTNGDTIVVAPSGPSPTGAYVENIAFPAKAVMLRSVDPQDPSIVAATVIDGDAAGSVITFTAGMPSGALLEGLTIRNGSADDGGGIYCNASSPTIRRCTITENVAARGGGIYCTGSSPRVTHCTMSLNAATEGEWPDDGGGGMANYGGSCPIVTGCTFVHNTTPWKGGGVGNFDNSGPIFTDCTFYQNAATDIVGLGGGMYGRDSSPVISRCAFVDNTAGWGGGLRETSTDAVVTDCVFIGNTANNYYWARGGGLENAGGNLRVINCAFIGNRAVGPEGHSGGAAVGLQATLTNCAFVGNVAEGTNVGVGGLLVYNDSEVALTNCVFWGNTGVFGPGETAQIYFDTAIVAINYTCVEGWTGAFGGVGNHGVNPLFTNPGGADGILGTADDDVRLRPGSPCIDAGDNEADTNAGSNGLQPLPDTDLAGNPRFVDDPSTDPDPGHGTPPIVDMGPYEYQPDCNSNGFLDIDDLAAGTSADCNSTGIPDECDLADGFSGDCNTNGIADECDIESGTSVDCQPNTVPDECEVDCNSSGFPDECDISAGTSEDCQPNGIPDECELAAGLSPDCNSNDVPDECDAAGGTSEDCQPNGTPDECELAAGLSADCNSNDVPDECDVAGGISQDCQPNGVPDECELAGNDCDSNGTPDECDPDCNTNGVADPCDIDAGTSGDCNTNGRPDECDVARCTSLWDGFQPDPPFSYNTPMSTIDYIPQPDGDGIYWSNPFGTAVIGLCGCEAVPPDPFDFSVTVTVPSTGGPESGYVASEYFQTESGWLAPEEDVYSLSFRPKVLGVYGDPEFNHKYDWQYFIYDAVSGAVVIQIEFVSSASARVPSGQRGKVLVRNPAEPPAHLDTGVELGFEFDPVSFLTGTPCYDFEVVLDNRRDSVELYIDGALKVETTRLAPAARRMDYFHLQAVENSAATGGDTTFKLDHFGLCLTGRSVPPAVYDCNGNGVLDECDITGGVSVDCNVNGVPDECEMGDFDADGTIGLTDYETFQSCFTGPGGGPVGAACELGDFDCDDDVDMSDFAAFQKAFTG